MRRVERILSFAWKSRAMKELIHIDRKELFLEIARYLAAVDLYRAEKCEPKWRPKSRPFVASTRDHKPGKARSVGALTTRRALSGVSGFSGNKVPS